MGDNHLDFVREVGGCVWNKTHMIEKYGERARRLQDRLAESAYLAPRAAAVAYICADRISDFPYWEMESYYMGMKGSDYRKCEETNIYYNEDSLQNTIKKFKGQPSYGDQPEQARRLGVNNQPMSSSPFHKDFCTAAFEKGYCPSAYNTYQQSFDEKEKQLMEAGCPRIMEVLTV